jgi:hypothetical protein
MRNAGIPFVLLAALALSACATPPTPYQPIGESARYGYGDEQIDVETWRVRFAGNRATDRGRVEDYVLYRAAEITVAAGADGFVVLREEVEKDVAYYGTTHAPYYGSFFFGHGHRSHFGLGFSTSTLRPSNSYTGHIRIRLFRQTAPEGLGPAYDARAVLKVLGPKIVRPAPE